MSFVNKFINIGRKGCRKLDKYIKHYTVMINKAFQKVLDKWYNNIHLKISYMEMSDALERKHKREEHFIFIFFRKIILPLHIKKEYFNPKH